ncbi:hypothetical protein Q4555_10375 [Octadecabacter sp. 1_MG-2023]|uniref:hypothetical protein n=1 Tax=unclassified Octadecabacter TaxID=196158 RepID=UPI001C0A0DF9|nr:MULTISPECIES: hypothetical protein [unclassified Octadecabacter]MBU2992165.1 hypothetical protein [Octadecabacter sp. B2R22]MDO6735079.1 hypothetical protein [Octadecabacter sp. 1_MG-2023]
MKKTLMTAALLVAASNTPMMAGDYSDAGTTDTQIIIADDNMAAPLSSSMGGAVLPVLLGLAVIAVAASGGS